MPTDGPKDTCHEAAHIAMLQAPEAAYFLTKSALLC